ncbi:MAG: HDIG domain-containing protein [Candidatus Omnitrophica bacterium]|nr:HDIG domain-containing protein [Candidatus Omnitrophota bacterium]
MAKATFKAAQIPKSNFFNYLVKCLMALAIWLLLFSLVYLNTQLNLFSVGDRFLYLLGIALLLAMLIIAGGTYLFLLDYHDFSRNKNLFLIALSVFLTAVFFEICVLTPLNIYAIPIAGMSILLVLLLNLNASLIVTLFLSLLFGLVVQGRLDLFLVIFLGGTVGAIAARNARRRSQLLGAGVFVGFFNFMIISFFGFFKGAPPAQFLKESLWGFGGGLLSSFLVTGFLPVFEILFNITTNITLLELSDLNNPLLKELIIKAPGTYHHSLIVGNLAEAACDAISANSLLARIGAYYHDIGKLNKPEYFSENESGESKSRHVDLKPTMSSLIITNHVKDGVDSAKKHKLPDSIIDFIEQHHGTGLIYYFYQRALEKTEDEDQLKEEYFRYPGPKPQTKETAVVLLADAVEASTRALSDATPAKIKTLTQKIINNKFIDGQLDECELSLRDLNRISECFIKILTGIFHTRVEYPRIAGSGA